jgi:hypothetical protein
MLWLTCFDVLCLGRLDSEGRFVTGSYDKQLITWHMERSQPESVIEGLRVTDLAVSLNQCYSLMKGGRVGYLLPTAAVYMYIAAVVSTSCEKTTIPLQIDKPLVLNLLCIRTQHSDGGIL